MRILLILFLGVIISGCSFTDRGVRIDFPRPNVDVCLNAVSNTEIIEMKSRIERESFGDDKMKIAMRQSKDRCFTTSQVFLLVDLFVFENDKLELAKFMYEKTDDKENYEAIVDLLTFANDREELRDYIATI